MTNGPSEPERYSIDEMMDRLKTRPSADAATDGELVTREDGTQAIRVRKRKRRSHQPIKEKAVKQRRVRAFQIIALVLALAVILISAGALFVYANSAPYRNGVIAKITSSTGANVELQQFRVNPSGANSSQVSFTWPDGNALKSLTLRNVRADVAVASLMGKSWRGEEIIATDGELALGLPDGSSPLLAQPLPTSGIPVAFGRMAVDKLNITLGKRDLPAVRIVGSEGSFYPRNSAGRPEVRISRGSFNVSGWPALEIDRAHFEFRKRLVEVVGIRFFAARDDNGVFELSGTLDPYNPSQDSALKARFEGFPIGSLVGESLGKIFSGRIDSREVASSNYLTFNSKGDQDAHLVLAFRSSLSSQMQLSGLPAFLALARGLADEWYAEPVFSDDATGTLRRDFSSVQLTDLSFTNKGRIALRGNLSLDSEQNLSGTLRLGLPETTIVGTKSQVLDRLFAESSDGFRWVELTISGHASRPMDNFLALYEAASTGGSASGADGSAPGFEELTKPR